MKELGSHLKAAIARVVDSLQHLRSEGSAVPTAARDGLAQIKAKYAADHARGDVDPLVFAGRSWAEEQIAEAIEKDEKANSDKGKAPAEAKPGSSDASPGPKSAGTSEAPKSAPIAPPTLVLP
jgi:hypothetical protein